MVRVLAAVAAILLAASLPAHAQFVQCNGCTTTQYMSLAESLGQSQGLGTKYIADFTHHLGTGWQVTRESNGHGFTYYADQVSLPANLAAGFHDWDVVYSGVGGAADVVSIIPLTRPSGYPTSVDSGTGLNWVTSSTNLNLLETWLINHQASINSPVNTWPTGSAKDLMIAYQSGTAVSSYTPDIKIVITMNDSSVITVTWDKDSPPAKLTKVVDPYGNTIPLSKADVSGTYSFGSGAGGGGAPAYGRNFGQYLMGMGVPVTYSSGGTIIAIVCVSGSCITEMK